MSNIGQEQLSVVVRFTFPCVHFWPAAFEALNKEIHAIQNSYLGYPHRHMMHVKVTVTVEHEDREIEVISLKDNLRRDTVEAFGQGVTAASCETIAKWIGARIVELYGHRSVTTEVLEDGENGGIYAWTPIV